MNFKRSIAVIAAAVLVYDARKVVLSCTAFSGDQDCQVGGSHRHGCLDRTVERCIVADDVEFVFYSLKVLSVHTVEKMQAKLTNSLK